MKVCEKCNGTGWIITKGKANWMTNYTSQSRCDCGFWIKQNGKFSGNPNYIFKKIDNNE